MVDNRAAFMYMPPIPMPTFPRLAFFLFAAFLPAWNGKARADDLFERLAALRVLQMQSNLWNTQVKSGLTLDGSLESRFTTNAALSRDGTSDWYLAPAASMSWGHELGDDWGVSAGCDAGGFRYLRQTDLGTSYLDTWGSVAREFKIGPAEAGVYAVCTQQWTQLKNYSKSGASTEILAGAHTGWEFRPGQTFAFNPYATATPYSSPWDSGYHSYGATLSYDLEACSHVDISVYYNGYLTCYFSGQNDFTQYVGTSITWSPWENFSLSASVTGTWNSSTNPDSEYTAVDAGGMLGLQWKL